MVQFVLYKYINVHNVTISKQCTWYYTFTSCSTFHYYQNVTDSRGVVSLIYTNLHHLHTQLALSRWAMWRWRGWQQQSCPCQLDPAHPPSGKRGSCILCDISTIFTSWKNCLRCQHHNDSSVLIDTLDPTTECTFTVDVCTAGGKSTWCRWLTVCASCLLSA